ncbi:MAG: DNA mismatch repair endonuclease MutL, partial [Clostridia bacterium]|nr:DNA mismatch repair endonuclease MutL [Clostridia bacterium]
VLDKATADKIAAGEVVERPSSVVKEFVENALDAGAKKITVEITDGGKSYIRVADDGCGIVREDVRVAFKSHATSKISTADDLSAIGTLGFRGEALASIAAVSRVELLTCAEGESVGTLYRIEGGEDSEPEDAGCPVGTTLVVRDLFYNVPARLKFLKKDTQEGNYIASVLERIAVSHPGVAFRFIRDGKPVFSTAGDGSLKAAVYAVFGREFTSQLLAVDGESNGVRVFGYTVKPIFGKGSRAMQMFYVNGRFVKSTLLLSALEAAYKNSVMVGRFPACVLFLTLPPETVDVNVHPAKTEVRLYDERRVFDAVYGAVQSALVADTSRPQAAFNPAKAFAPAPAKGEQLHVSQITPPPHIPTAGNTARFSVKEYGAPQSGAEDTFRKPSSPEEGKQLDFLEDEYNTPNVATLRVTFHDETAAVPEQAPQQPAPEPPEEEFRLLGEAFKTYLIVEQASKLLLIDKHAAHERILFEKFRAEQHSSSQMLLQPVTVTLSADEYAAVIENLPLLSDAGYDVSDFGDRTVKVSACPPELAGEDLTELVT